MRTSAFTSAVDAILAATPIYRLLSKADAVILERIAMGAGATRWYYCCNEDRLEAVKSELSPGSRVSFYFDGRIRSAPYSADVRSEAEKIIFNESEAVIGRLLDDGLHIEFDCVTGCNDLDDFASTLSAVSRVFFGPFPASDNDGIRAVTVTLPDADGVVRSHPH